MKNTKKILRGTLLGIAFSLLILDAKCAATGVAEGIALCLETVIPALFPFLLLSPMLIAYVPNLSVFRILGRFLGMPSGSEPIFLTSLLCGYPVGARMVANARKAGQLSREDAQRMLAFCNNAGPAFIFGVGSAVFSDKWIPWFLWLIHILSAMLVGSILPGKSRKHYTATSKSIPTFRSNLEKSIVTMAHICGWIIVMRIVQSFLDRWILWLLPQWVQVLLCGTLELANGCIGVRSVNNPVMKFLMMTGFLAFGGISVHMQTASVIGDLGGMKYHLMGKLLQTVISLILAVLLLAFTHTGVSSSVVILFLIISAVMFFTLILLLSRKNSSIPKSCGV